MAKSITGDGTTTYSTTAGKRYVFSVAGDFGSGTMSLQWSDGTTDVTFKSFTADEAVEIVAPSRTIKAVLASSTSPVLLIDLVPVIKENYI